MKNLYWRTFDEIRASEHLRQEVWSIRSQGQRTGEYPKRRRCGKWILTAACVCILLSVGVLAVELIRGSGVSVQNVKSGWGETGYQTTWEVERISADAFSDEVKAALEQLRQEFENTDDQVHFYGWESYHSTWQEAEQYLGVPLPNPLEEQEWLAPSGYYTSSGAPLNSTDDRSHCHIYLVGDQDGEHLLNAQVLAGYMSGRVWLQLETWLCTEYMDETTLTSYIPDAEQAEETYRTGSGADVIVMKDGSRLNAYFCYENRAYILEAKLANVYGLSASEKTDAEVRQALEDALTCF